VGSRIGLQDDPASASNGRSADDRRVFPNPIQQRPGSGARELHRGAPRVQCAVCYGSIGNRHLERLDSPARSFRRRPAARAWLRIHQPLGQSL